MSKIFVISDGLPNPDNLLGTFEMDQALALKSIGHDVYFIAFNSYPFRHKRKYEEKFGEYKGIPYIYKSFPFERRPLMPFANMAAIMFRGLMIRAIDKFGMPDVVHAHFIYQAFLAAKAKNIYNCPLVITEHSSLINRDNISPGYIKMGKIAYNRADKVICVSSALQNKLKLHFSINAILIPNILEIDTFVYNENKNRRGIVSTSNLVPLKRVDLLIRAFAKAFEGKDVSLDIFGDGPEKLKLQKLIDSLNANNKVKLRGMATRQQLAQAYNNAKAFVMLSSTETFGVVYAEAIMSGLPVVSTLCGGPEDYINKNNGLLIPVDDELAAIYALKSIYKNSDNYDRRYMGEELRENFAPQTIAKRLEYIYNSI
ncbi:MAG: glycosyltransferase family 4 protein [Christensenellaceae bacterium]|nr:glycosyltransferase family 4 protein [Christensenellaceae bacterium]